MTRAEIMFVRSLADRRSRDEHGLFIAEGEKLVGEILQSDMKVRNLYAMDNCTLSCGAERVTAKEMERISQLKTPSSVVAVVETPKFDVRKVNPQRELVLALDRIQNPGNLGTIIRLADWFGIENIVCSADTADCFNPKVVQASMGAILRVRVHYTDLACWLVGCGNNGVPVYGTFLDGEDIYSTELSREGVVVMGNEGSGISRECAEQVSRRLYIPPFPPSRHGSESLNVSIATAVVCAEFRRRSL